jgi:hypothetical protein
MKLFLPLILTSLFASISSDEVDGTPARVIIHGVQGDLTPQDVQLVHDTIAALAPSVVPIPSRALRVKTSDALPANDESSLAEGTEGQILEILSARSRPSPAPPPKTCGGWGCGGYNPKNPAHRRGYWSGYGSDFSCGRLCPNDDKWMADAAWTLIISNLPKPKTNYTEDEQVCDSLRRHGSPVLSQATSCNIAPMISGPTVSALCIDGAKAGEAMVFIDVAEANVTETIDLDEYLTSLTEDEVHVVETSVTEAFNEAFADIGLVLQSFRALDVAEPSTDDASSDAGLTSTVIIGEFYQLCTDVDLNGKSKELEMMHHLFEVKLCQKLHDSGFMVFEKVKTCAYRTFHNRVIAKKNIVRVSGSVLDN